MCIRDRLSTALPKLGVGALGLLIDLLLRPRAEVDDSGTDNFFAGQHFIGVVG